MGKESVQFYAKSWYLRKTKQNQFLQLRSYALTVSECLDASEMKKYKIYGGNHWCSSLQLGAFWGRVRDRGIQIIASKRDSW